MEGIYLATELTVELDQNRDFDRRIVLIHALHESIGPCLEAFRDKWPQARLSNLLDDALPRDLTVEGGEITKNIVRRFQRLTQYAGNDMSTREGPVHGILFTCSAFGEAIERAKAIVSIPVLSPFEAAFEAAARRSPRVGLIVSFAPALALLQADFEKIAARLNLPVQSDGAVAEGALEALKAGDAAEHDRLVVAAAERLPHAETIVLCQFSLARAAEKVKTATDKVVMTTPSQAVDKLMKLTDPRVSSAEYGADLGSVKTGQ
jgi:Asp/Glu/hydantoin racemase